VDLHILPLKIEADREVSKLSSKLSSELGGQLAARRGHVAAPPHLKY
jgi:hypothetical protein